MASSGVATRFASSVHFGENSAENGKNFTENDKISTWDENNGENSIKNGDGGKIYSSNFGDCISSAPPVYPEVFFVDQPLELLKFREIDFVDLMKKTKDVVIVHIEPSVASDRKIFVHVGDFVDQHFQMLADLNELFARVLSYQDPMVRRRYRLARFAPGQVCTAKFDDGVFYRAEILTASENHEEVSLRFVDYGNEEIVAKKNVKILLPKFCRSLPKQGIPCRVINGFWVFNGLVDVKSLIGKKFEATFMNLADDGSWQIRIAVDEPENQLKFETTSFGAGEKYFRIPDPEIDMDDEDETYVVSVVKFKSLDNFFVFFQAELKALNEFEAALTRTYKQFQKSGKLRYMLCREPGCSCVIDVQGAFYRCEVVGMEGDDVRVVKVDYGSEEVVRVKNCFALVFDDENAKRFLETPRFVIRCSMNGVVEDDSYKGGGKKLKALMEEDLGVERECKFILHDYKKQTFIVDLLMKNNQTVANYLIKNGMVRMLATNDAKKLLRSPVTPGAVSLCDDADFLPLVDIRSMAVSRMFDVNVCHIESAKEFYVAKKDSEEIYEQLFRDLQNFYASPVQRRNLLNPAIDSVCAAKFAGTFFRCTIRQRPSPAIYEVFFVDFGRKEKVGKDATFILDRQFQTLPPRVFSCALKKVKASDETKAKFMEIFEELGKVGTIQIDGKLNGDRTFEVTLWNGEREINNVLRKVYLKKTDECRFYNIKNKRQLKSNESV